MARQPNKRAAGGLPNIFETIDPEQLLFGANPELLATAAGGNLPKGDDGDGVDVGFNPADLVSKNPVAQGVGKLAEAQALNEQGGARRDASGRITNFDPSPFGGPIQFQGAAERLADMTNHTGAYAPTDAVARLNAQAAGAPVHQVGSKSYRDGTLAPLSARGRENIEGFYAPRVADKNYSHGRPVPVPGRVHSGEQLAAQGKVAANRGLPADDEDFGNPNYIGLGTPSQRPAVAQKPTPLAPSALAQPTPEPFYLDNPQTLGQDVRGAGSELINDILSGGHAARLYLKNLVHSMLGIQ